ncbi:MAG: TonB-dependent receptor [Planctomycetales bacterium]|nr:TonB-dependent receptor [Planctomycetales bacterium]
MSVTFLRIKHGQRSRCLCTGITLMNPFDQSYRILAITFVCVSAATGPVFAQIHSEPIPDVALQQAVSPEAVSNDATTRALSADGRIHQLFGDVNQVDDLEPNRRVYASSPGTNVIFSDEALGRRTSDVSQLLQRSKAAQGVAIQYRTPISSDTRVRGQRVGQVLASGSYWAPARMDMDSMMSAIDSRLIEDLILIKGPYATRYGPGFRFVDIEFIHSPRYEQMQTHGSTKASYNSNGQQWNGRQSFWGGDQDSGFFVSYGHQTGNDYETGRDDFFMPASYKSRDVFLAVGHDLSAHESIEFNLIRLDQTDVEYPGMVCDINYLVTDGYEATYTNDDPFFADRFSAELWYNRTRFEGDSSHPAKNEQIPQLGTQLNSPSGLDGIATVDGDALSGGYRLESRFLNDNGYYSFGTDMILLNQQINDVEPNRPPADNNNPIPRSHSVDFGLYVEDVEQIHDDLTMTAGLRVDGVFADAGEKVLGVPAPLSVLKRSPLDQQFLLGAAYLTAEYQYDPNWTCSFGLGAANRPPTLTELYSEFALIGSLQRGLTFLLGDPQLRSEKLYQIDLAARYSDDRSQFGASVYHAWVNDFITYDLIDPPGIIPGFQEGAAFVNTDLATLAGFELYAQRDVNELTGLFGTVSYTEGRDLTRTNPARLSAAPDRSATPGIEHEPLPGIHPLEMRLGILIQDPSAIPQWGLELMARVVDNQDRVARTLQEQPTPGFTTYDLRAYRRIDQWLLTSGVENLTNKFYQEHIDFRVGRGVYRPGIAFYCGAEVRY